MPTLPRTYLCSFCSKDQAHVQRLIAGPGGVYICNECVVRIAGESDEERGANAERCSFCGKGKIQQHVLYIRRGPGPVAICNECVALCQSIIEKEAHE